MTEHTPGPWIVNGLTLATIQIHGHGKVVAEITQPLSRRSKWPYNQGIANARLIAAAPETAAERDRLRKVNAELVAALESIIDVSCIETITEITRAALAKAKESLDGK